MRLVIYIRVSSAEQVEGYSLEAQETACRQWAASNGYDVAHIFVEPGQSARTDRRPAFQQMIAIVRTTPQIDAILIHKSDRIARNLLDLLSYRNMLETNGKHILSVTEPFFNDDSPENRMVCGIVGSVNEFYSANLSREVKKGQVQKAKSGSFPGGRLPLGYCRNDKKIIIVDQHAVMIKSAFFEFSNGGYTLRSWATKSAELGYTHNGKPLSASSWQKIFRNPFYTGQFTWQGETFNGDHPLLVDEETFAQIQTILTDADTGGSKNRNFWLLSGLLWSTKYDIPMSGTLNNNNAYYRAKAKTKLEPEHLVRADMLEKQVIELLGEIRLKQKGGFVTGREEWRLAINVAPSMINIWNVLPTPQERRKFLLMIFWRIFVEPGGAVLKSELHQPFEFR
jgi:site-specific DNA recombinase